MEFFFLNPKTNQQLMHQLARQSTCVILRKQTSFPLTYNLAVFLRNYPIKRCRRFLYPCCYVAKQIYFIPEYTNLRKKSLKTAKKLTFPTKDDVDGSLEALALLQRIYKMNITEFASGRLFGKNGYVLFLLKNLEICCITTFVLGHIAQTRQAPRPLDISSRFYYLSSPQSKQTDDTVNIARIRWMKRAS